MNDSNNRGIASGGVGIGGLLGIVSVVLVVLKLCKSNRLALDLSTGTFLNYRSHYHNLNNHSNHIIK